LCTKTLQVIIDKNETKSYQKVSKYIEKEYLSRFGTVIADLRVRALFLDCETVQITSKSSRDESCGISGRGKNKRGLASSALNQTKYQRVI